MPPGVDAGTIYSEVRVRLDKLTADLASINTQFDKFAQANTKHTEKVEKGWKDSFKQVDLAGVAAMAGVSIALKSTINVFSEFQQSVANAFSVSAKPTIEEYRLLEAAAEAAGESTRFTATQAADALYSLASAGLTAKESTEALNGVLQLAGATQSDLAFTSETVTAVLAQFNMQAKEAGAVSNIFAAGIAASQATMAKLANSMSYVGPVASAFNLSLQETTAVLGILYNNGLEASTAGTALRSALTDMSNAASPAVKKLKELGISFKDVNPQTHSFSEIIGVLSDKMLDGADIMAVFGDRAGPATIKLVDSGSEAIKNMTEAVTGTDAASRAYAIQNDTLAGSFDMMTSKAESVAIKFGKEFAPALRIVMDLTTGLLNAIGMIPGPIKIFIGLLAAAIPVILGINVALGAFAGLMTIISGPIGLAVFAIAAVTGVVVTMAKGVDDSTKRWISQKEAIDMNVKSIKEYQRLTIYPDVKSADDLKKKLKEIDALIKNARAEAKKLEETQLSDKRTTATIEFRGDKNYKVTDTYGMTESAIKKAEEQNRILDQTAKKNEGLIKIYNKVNELEAARLEVQRQISDFAKSEYEKKVKLSAEELAANEKLQEATEDYKKKIQDLNASELQRIELSRDRELKAIELSEAEIDKKRELIKVTNEYYDTLKSNAIEEQSKKVKAYQDRLASLYQGKLEAIEAERERALEEVKTLGLTDKALEDSTKAINDYYDKLKEKEAFNIFMDGLQNISNSLSNLFKASADSQIAELDRQLQAELEAKGLKEETEGERLQRELDAAIEAGDQKIADEKRIELARFNLTKEYEKRKAEIQYQAAMSQWQMTLAIATAQAASAIITAVNSAPFPWNIPAIGFATASTGIPLATILMSQPQPPAFKTGGIVAGSDYNGDNNLIRADSGELVINRADQLKLWNWIKGGAAGSGVQQSNQFNIYNQVDLEMASRDIAKRTQAALDT